MNKHLRHYLLLLFVLAIAGVARVNTFWQPHESDDELFNIALALKLDSLGLQGYNLARVNTDPFSLDGKTKIVELVLAPEEDKGHLLKALAKRGFTEYERPLHYQSPGLPFILMISQKSIGGGNGYFYSATKFDRWMRQVRPVTVFRAQLYATLLPFLFSLLFVGLIYASGRRLFDRETGLIAAAIMACNPISLLVAQRIWSDEMSACFVLLSLLFVAGGFEKRSPLHGLMAGLSVGIAVLFKQTAGIFLIALLLFYTWQSRKNLLKPEGIKRFFLNTFMLMLGVGFIVTSAWWFILVYKHYGTPFYFPVFDSLVNDHFYAIRQNRPHGGILFTLGLVYLSPLLVFAVALFWKKIRENLPDSKSWQFSLVFFWVISFYLIMAFVFESKEHQHMLTGYAAVAIAAAWVINLIRNWAFSYTRNWTWLNANELLVVVLIIAARWSTILVSETINRGTVLILSPF